MPLLVREYLEKHISGNNTPCAIVAVYGNRHFDDCLVEMEDLLTEKGFLVTAAAACLGEHSYTCLLYTSSSEVKLIQVQVLLSAPQRKRFDQSVGAFFIALI